jgi:HAE1 family hydrophobic/amphiphilic exporter-1
MITTATGGSIPLSMIADVKVELAPLSIARSNQTRTITITGNSLSGDAAGIAASVQNVIDNYDFPDGVIADNGGEMEEIQESFTTLAYALAVALGLVYFILAAQFESFIMPVIIMLILRSSKNNSLLRLLI